MAGTESLLDDYLKKSRETRERIERSEVVRRVEAVFDELQLPWQRDDDAWVVSSDLGVIHSGLDDDEEVLTFHQIVHPMDKADKKEGEYYSALLRMNMGSTGACFAMYEDDYGQRSIVVVGRIAATSLDAPEVALTLESVFRMLSAYDQ
jgi:hypothetical protein